MKLDRIINEGTWSSPRTVEQAKELQQIMQSPVPASDAADQIYHLVGDDDLFDQIAEIQDDDPNADVRFLIANKLKEWLREGQAAGFAAWKEPWDPEALQILRQIVNKHATK